MRSCFVIMPFSDSQSVDDNRWSDLYENCIEKAVKNCNINYSCYRSLDPHGNFMRDIASNLLEADVVIAVLTEFRPNVLYELGARHALRSKTIMIIEEGGKIPSDLSAYIAIRYSTKTIKSREKLAGELTEKIEKMSNEDPDSDNPINDFLEQKSSDLRREWYENENPDELVQKLKKHFPKYTSNLLDLFLKANSKSSIKLLENSPFFLDKPDVSAEKLSDTLTNEGLRLKDLYDFEKAKRCFQSAVEKNPDNVVAVGNLALLEAILNHNGARQKNESLNYNKSFPNTEEGLNAKGKVYLLEGRYEEAAESFLQAFEIDRGSAIYANNAGFAFEMKSDIDRAMEYYSLSLELNSSFAHALYNKGKALLKIGKKELSRESLRLANEIDPFVAADIEAQRVYAGLHLHKTNQTDA